LFDKLTNTITNHLSKANKQFANYRQRVKGKNTVTICVILNSTVMEFSPQTVSAVIQRKMNVIPKEDLPKYYNIDAVVYISEKHVAKLSDNRNAFSLVVFHAAGAMDQPWKMQLIDYFTTKWSDERTDGKFEGKIEQPFTVVDDIPDRMTRGEAVRLAYKRNPYLRNLSNADLGERWNPSVALSALSFVTGDCAERRTSAFRLRGNMDRLERNARHQGEPRNRRSHVVRLSHDRTERRGGDRYTLKPCRSSCAKTIGTNG